MIRRASHAPRLTGFDSRPSDSPARIAACVSTPPSSRRPCGIRTNWKPLSVLAGQVVVAGDHFVRDHEIRLDQIPHRQVVPDQVFEKLDRLLPQLGACVACEFGKSLAVRFEHIELVQIQPLGREFTDEVGELRIFDHPRHFGIHVFAKRAAARQFQRDVIRRSVPQEVG